MLQNIFDKDPDPPFCFVWFEVYKNYDALLVHLANTALRLNLVLNSGLGTDFSIELYGTL